MRARGHRPGPAVALLVPLLVLVGCGRAGGPGPGDEAGDGPGGAQTVSGRVVVLAASSLTESFTALGARFEAAHPGTTVSFSFAASSQLAAQVEQGAPADVFASASPAVMALVAEGGDVAGRPATFARNTLQLVVPAGNPGRVTGLEDLARTSLVIALCAPQVPCGEAAEAVLAAAGVTPAPDSLEADAKATLGKVLLGEVDAALVYRTDVLAAGDEVEGIDFPEAARAVNDYPIAVLARAPNPVAARAFVDLVRSPVGAEVLQAAGFELP